MALQFAATSSAIYSELALIRAWSGRLAHRLGATVSERAHEMFHPYRPELHYMRGPGPKWREKHRMTAACKLGRTERITD